MVNGKAFLRLWRKLDSPKNDSYCVSSAKFPEQFRDRHKRVANRFRRRNFRGLAPIFPRRPTTTIRIATVAAAFLRLLTNGFLSFCVGKVLLSTSERVRQITSKLALFLLHDGETRHKTRLHFIIHLIFRMQNSLGTQLITDLQDHEEQRTKDIVQNKSANTSNFFKRI